MDQTTTILIIMYTALAGMIFGTALFAFGVIREDRQRRKREALGENFSS